MIEALRSGEQRALGLVVAIHANDNDAAARLLYDVSDLELMATIIALTNALDGAWSELCEADDVPFSDFTQTVGVWLAGGRP